MVSMTRALRLGAHREQLNDLLGGEYDGNRLGLPEVIDLGDEIVPPHRHLQQELDAGHDAVAVVNAPAAVDEMPLEAAHIVGCRRLGRTAQVGRELLACEDIAALRAPRELAGNHVLDHALAQRGTDIRGHRELAP
jgi:hypothetical protein